MRSNFAGKESKMKTRTIATLALLLLATVTPVWAEEKSAAAGPASMIAPFLDEQAFAVARVDLTRLRLEPLFDELARLVPESKDDTAELRAQLSGDLAALVQAGAREIYAVATLNASGSYNRLPVTAFLVVPLGPEAREAAVRAVFPFPDEAKQRIGNALVMGEPQTLKRLAGMKPDPRPALSEAFAAAGETAAQGILLPPAYFRRVFSEAFPTLPNGLGNGPSSVLTRGIDWAALALGMPGQARVRLIVKSDDAQAAQALRQKWTEIAGLLAKREDVLCLVPKFEQIVPLVTPKVEGDRLVLTLNDRQGIDALTAALKLPAESVVDSVRRSRSTKNLKHIALAMHNYHDVYKHFPSPASFGPDGKPLLSWRVHVLPFIEQNELYKQFHLNEPWDSEHNKKLIAQMPAVYRSPKLRLGEKGRTNYLVPVGNGALFSSMQDTPTFRDMTDGTSNTIMVVEANDQHAVVWTRPDDLEFDPADPTKGLRGVYRTGFLTVFADGSANFIKFPENPEQRSILKAFFTRAGGEAVQRYW